ncbi:MAG TPA: protein kinase [Polyangiaceae bacterium]|nr:protein kinase [Polyangiaceae bacterium]
MNSAARVAEVAPESSFTPVVSSSGMSYIPFLELGEGGMAKIFLARGIGQSGFNKLLVLKSMRPNLLDDEGLRQMFVDEARLSARFNHPNLVQVQEVNPNAEPPYLVMEYLDGKPMSSLRESDGITLGMRLCIISEVLTGLHYAHELGNFDGTPLGIVHRDVSPHNVFITYDGSVKVLDFGIAKQVTNSTTTEAGEVKGKLAYMAPEQLLGMGVDRRADIFSVGSLLWEAVVGKRMWDGVSEATLMHRLVSGEIPRPSEQAQVDPELEEIIVKATAPNAEDRYATAAQLRLELDGYIARAGEHCSLRQIGAELGQIFEVERRRHTELINAALRESVRPAPGPEATEVPTTISEAPPQSRAPLFAVGALILLAVAGFLAPKIWSVPSSVAPDASLTVAPPPPAATVDAARAVPATPPPVAAPTPEAVAAPSEPAPSASVTAESAASGKEKKKAAASRGVPAAAPPATATAKAPAAEDRCSPPYYFVGGIKTYKPECL